MLQCCGVVLHSVARRRDGTALAVLPEFPDLTVAGPQARRCHSSRERRRAALDSDRKVSSHDMDLEADPGSCLEGCLMVVR